MGIALGVLVGKGRLVGIALAVGVIGACSGGETQAASNSTPNRNIKLLFGFDFIDEIQMPIPVKRGRRDDAIEQLVNFAFIFPFYFVGPGIHLRPFGRLADSRIVRVMSALFGWQ